MVFSVAFVLAVFLQSFHEHFKLFLAGFLAGIIISGTLSCLILGWEQVLELGKMFLYWIKFFPPRFSEPFISDANEHYLWVPQLVIGILIVCGIQLIVSFRESKNFQSFVRKNTHIIILLSLSVMVLKIGLDCSDKRHFRAMSSPSLLLLFSLTTGWLDKLNEFRLRIVQSYTAHKTVWILVLILLLFINMHPKEAFRHVKPYWKHISATDDNLLAAKRFDYLTAVEEMRQEVKDMECFYTLTSEGIWYYYLNKPSCARHHILLWAVPKEASNEIVDSLQSKQPGVILFSNYRSNKSFVVSHLHPEVYKFVYENYKPYKLLGNHWFWKRSSGGVMEGQMAELDITRTITSIRYDNKEGFVVLDGLLSLKSIYSLDGLYITLADQDIPLATISYHNRMTRIKSDSLEGTWSIGVPMVSIFPETKKFQLWGYSSSLHERIKIGEKFALDPSKINMKSNYVR